MFQFVLRSGVTGWGFDDFGNRTLVELPAWAELLSIDAVPEDAPEDPAEMINVFWNGRVAAVFLIDLQECGVLQLDAGRQRE
jgi:hypothetical protein